MEKVVRNSNSAGTEPLVHQRKLQMAQSRAIEKVQSCSAAAFGCHREQRRSHKHRYHSKVGDVEAGYHNGAALLSVPTAAMGAAATAAAIGASAALIDGADGDFFDLYAHPMLNGEQTPNVRNSGPLKYDTHLTHAFHVHRNFFLNVKWQKEQFSAKTKFFGKIAAGYEFLLAMLETLLDVPVHPALHLIALLPACIGCMLFVWLRFGC